MSLAIAEKRPQRPGGCAGIFFQLFDWNRRFAKKRLFSKKLLPPVRAVKRVSKKFGTDDKMPKPKLLMIANENRGGSPKAEAETFSVDNGSGMRAPGLVARLMGLESMPVVHQEKPRKALDSEFYHDNDGSCEYSRLDQRLCSETLAGHNGKLEPRPQKLQKTGGFLERQPVSAGTSRFSPEVFHKAVLSRSRKHHHKLSSPVKSPRLLSRSSSSTARLVQAAATKILEPGLQSRSRARCAITYLRPLEGDAMGAKELGTDSLVGSCRSCGNLVEVSDLSLGREEHFVTDFAFNVSDFSNGSSSYNGFEETRSESPAGVPGGQIRPPSLAVQAKLNVQSRANDVIVERKHQRGSDQEQCKPRKEVTLKPALRRNNLRQNQLPVVRDELVPGNKVFGRKQSSRDLNELNGAKDFVALNKNLNNSARVRSPNKASGSHRVDVERNGWDKNVRRKRRPINSPHVGNVGAINSTVARERSLVNDLTTSKETQSFNHRDISRSCIKSELPKKEDDDNFGVGKDGDIVSFTFSSPMRQQYSRSFAHEKVGEKCSSQGESICNSSQRKKLASGAKIRNLSSQTKMPLRGDELSSLLEEKIRELASLDQDELATRDALPVRSTASILEELISALTKGDPLSQTNDDSCSDVFVRVDNTTSRNQMVNINKKFQDEAQAEVPAANSASDSNQPSPVSILEASFSNDSCSFGSLNSSSGGKLLFGLEEICSKTHSLDLDSDLLDSATSMNITNSGTGKYPCSIDRKDYFGIRSQEAVLSETKPPDATEVISDAELLFENISLYWSDGTLKSFFDSFLLDTLETIADAFSPSRKCNLSSIEVKEANQLREFLFDCILECLDSKYSNFWTSGFRTWLKLPWVLNINRLRSELPEEIRGWRNLAGKALDDLVDGEMSRSTVKWIVREAEAFETGMEIESDILQALVDEMVVDLCLC